MSDLTSIDIRYPAGRFQLAEFVTDDDRRDWIAQIEDLPDLLERAVDGLEDAQLDTPYREDGWTLRQVVHHIPDSHANAYVRFKLALTEDHPRIRPYMEGRWAELADARSAPIDLSLLLVRALHARWVFLLRSLSEEDWQRTFDHPDGGSYSLTKALATYAWHGRHHVAHINSLRERRGW